MKKYDYIIAGSGLFGAVFAHEAVKNGKKVLVLERRGHIGGNIYTERLRVLTCINMARISSTPQTSGFGIM